MILGVDSNKNMFRISDNAEKSASFRIGDVIECMPSKAFGNSIVLDDESFIRKIEDSNIPTIADLRTKITDVKVGNDYCIEGIILKPPERREVQTKTGEYISLAEMFVEDDTGQIWVKGWRNQARLLDKFAIGEIVSVISVTARAGLEGRVELFLTPFSSIVKKS